MNTNDYDYAGAWSVVLTGDSVNPVNSVSTDRVVSAEHGVRYVVNLRALQVTIPRIIASACPSARTYSVEARETREIGDKKARRKAKKRMESRVDRVDGALWRDARV